MSKYGQREGGELCEARATEGIGNCRALAYARCHVCRAWRCFAHMEVQKDEGIMKCQGGCQKVKEETSGKQLEKSA